MLSTETVFLLGYDCGIAFINPGNGETLSDGLPEEKALTHLSARSMFDTKKTKTVVRLLHT